MRISNWSSDVCSSDLATCPLDQSNTPMALSSLALSKAKPREKPYKLADGHGLYLLITPQGGRYWRMNYRFGGKAKTMAMGVFPLITLAEAREKRDAARRLLAAGSDPSATRKEAEAREAFEATTGFRTVAEEWLAHRTRDGLGAVTPGQGKDRKSGGEGR